MKRKVIIFPRGGRATSTARKQETLSVANWLVSLDSLQHEGFKDDLDAFLNIVWLHRYMTFYSEGRVEADEYTLERILDFVNMTICYLAKRLKIPALLEQTDVSKLTEGKEAEIYKKLCALLEPYLSPAALEG